MVRLLTIGNSLAQDATRQLEQIAAAHPGNVALSIGKANLGGCSLEKHWNLVEQCDLLPDVKPYNFYLTGEECRPITLREALISQPWDYVTLQQVTDLSWRPETYHPYIDRLHALVRELAPHAQPAIHQTWAYRADATPFAEWGIDQQRMYDGLTEAYNGVARQFQCRILPCGHAFQKARALLRFAADPRFDYANPTPMALPDQSASLIVGYHWRTGNTPSGKAEFHQDCRHGNTAGCYLAGAVWFEMLTGESILENPFRPDGVGAQMWELLRQVAHETVAEHGGPLT
jgi:hypothetical protein